MLRPDLFYFFNIYDNSFLSYKTEKIFLPFKGNKDSYTITGCDYDKKGVKPHINNQGVFTWNFEQGKNKPITFKEDLENQIDGKLIEEIKKSRMDDLWFQTGSMKDFINTWGVVIIGVILIAMIGYNITKNDQSNQQIYQVIVNLTRR